MDFARNEKRGLGTHRLKKFKTAPGKILGITMQSFWLIILSSGRYGEISPIGSAIGQTPVCGIKKKCVGFGFFTCATSCCIGGDARCVNRKRTGTLKSRHHVAVKPKEGRQHKLCIGSYPVGCAKGSRCRFVIGLPPFQGYKPNRMNQRRGIGRPVKGHGCPPVADKRLQPCRDQRRATLRVFHDRNCGPYWRLIAYSDAQTAFFVAFTGGTHEHQ